MVTVRQLIRYFKVTVGFRNLEEIITMEHIWRNLAQQFHIPDGNVDEIKNLRKHTVAHK